MCVYTVVSLSMSTKIGINRDMVHFVYQMCVRTRPKGVKVLCFGQRATDGGGDEKFQAVTVTGFMDGPLVDSGFSQSYFSGLALVDSISSKFHVLGNFSQISREV